MIQFSKTSVWFESDIMELSALTQSSILFFSAKKWDIHLTGNKKSMTNLKLSNEELICKFEIHHTFIEHMIILNYLILGINQAIKSIP